MVVKFPVDQIMHNRQSPDEFQLSTWECLHMRNWGLEKEGKLTLSIKVGKKRCLVPGRLAIYEEYGCNYERYYFNYYFIPNNRAKLLGLLT